MRKRDFNALTAFLEENLVDGDEVRFAADIGIFTEKDKNNLPYRYKGDVSLFYCDNQKYELRVNNGMKISFIKRGNIEVCPGYSLILMPIQINSVMPIDVDSKAVLEIRNPENINY